MYMADDYFQRELGHSAQIPYTQGRLMRQQFVLSGSNYLLPM